MRHLLLVLVLVSACSGASQATPTPACPPCEACAPPSSTAASDGVTEIVARPLRPDGLESPPGCGTLVFWAETIVEVRSVTPTPSETPEHLTLRIECPPAMTAECVRARVPTARYLDAASVPTSSGFQLQVTTPIEWIACPE